MFPLFPSHRPFHPTAPVAAGVKALAMSARGLLIGALVSACLALSTHAASAAARGPLCPGKLAGPAWTHLTTGASGSHYEVSTLGRAWTCTAATRWVKEFITESVPSRTTFNRLSGPKGYPCKALSDKQGKAFSGSCLKLGGAAVSGFSWAPVK